MTLRLSSPLDWRAPSGSNSKVLSLTCALVLAAFTFSCTIDERQSGIPDKAQTAINTFTEDFNAGRFDNIYQEAANEWRSGVTLEQSNQTFRTQKERLGVIKERTFMGGRRQQNESADLPANSLVVSYNTKFDRADGIETFTLIERDGRYQLAGYSVSSYVLK